VRRSIDDDEKLIISGPGPKKSWEVQGLSRYVEVDVLEIQLIFQEDGDSLGGDKSLIILWEGVSFV
jgi:hypothetical protein